jgi:hypothetical protein
VKIRQKNRKLSTKYVGNARICIKNRVEIIGFGWGSSGKCERELGKTRRCSDALLVHFFGGFFSVFGAFWGVF